MNEEPELSSGPQSRSILLVCTRDPRGRVNGRKLVLRTIIDALTALGHSVTVAYFGATEKPEDPENAGDQRYVAVPGLSVSERLASVVQWLFGGVPSLNEGLYRSRRAKAVLIELARESGSEIVITDMLRTADYGACLGLPWIADLDDLLSRRYRLLAASYDTQTNVLGYYQSSLGRFAQRVGAWLMPWVLRREAAAIEKREIDVVNTAHVTTLVSAAEAKVLSQIAGHNVQCAPMAVSGPSEPPSLNDRPLDLVFLGGLDYGPNLKSVRQFDTEILPKLVARGITDLKLHVVGHPADAVARLSEAIILEGYVEDLNAAMQQYRAMLVPAVLPGGVKTKIIVAALNGTLVLAHPNAVDGMDLQHGREILVWKTADELAELLHRLRRDEIDIGKMASAARVWAEQRYSLQTLSEIWRKILSQALDRDLAVRRPPGRGE